MSEWPAKAGFKVVSGLTTEDAETAIASAKSAGVQRARLIDLLDG